MANKVRVADYIAQRAVEAGAQHVFLVTGGGAMHLNDAFGRHPNLTPVCFHHEQAAAFAAVAYAQYSGKVGACLVSTGCASTNALTGVLSAKACSGL